MQSTYVLLMIALILFAGATVYGTVKISQKSDAAYASSQASFWLVASFEREYLKMSSMFWRYAAENTGLETDALLTQYDVLRSRITLMEEGSAASPLQQFDSYHHAIPPTAKLMRYYEEQIFTAVSTGQPLFREFLDAYFALADPIHRYMVDIHLNRSWAFDSREAQIKDTRIAIYVTLTGTLVSTLLLLGIAIIQLKARQENLTQTLVALSQGKKDSYALRDEVTHRESIEKERTRLVADLEARNEELERYAYTISHDLKSPLYTIQGFAGFLERDVRQGNSENMLEDLSKIKDAVRTMSRLLDDILNLSRVDLDKEPREQVLLDDIVADAITMVSGEIESHAVSVKFEPGLPKVFGEPQRLTEVFQNLISNSAKFMGSQKIPEITVGASNEQEWVHCYVEDNGIGIEQDYHERVFNLFERLDNSTRGTGIGLAIVKRIIERHGGTVWIESGGRNTGCRFNFTLPMSTRIRVKSA